jgi:3-isopropylmalate/(R)-2-methylmalate dehydratase large subunit
LGKKCKCKRYGTLYDFPVDYGGATGYFGNMPVKAVRNLTMEERMTSLHLSIEMGARGGLVLPIVTTFNYIKGREFAPKGEKWEKAVAYWKTLKSDDGAAFDKEVTFRCGARSVR